MPFNHKKRSQEAEAKARDSRGHFVPESDQPSGPPVPSDPSKSSISSFFKQLISPSVSKTEDQDTLIDVHVGNPLYKIIEILQEIKKQKAFSFSLKGSLGLAGIALVITGAGIFGGTEAFCSKGVQSHIGTIKVLQTQEKITESSIPILPQLLSLLPGGRMDSWDGGTTRNRTSLIKSDNSTIHLIQPKNSPVLTFLNQPVIATGDYNSCSQTLTLKEPTSIELFK